MGTLRTPRKTHAGVAANCEKLLWELSILGTAELLLNLDAIVLCYFLIELCQAFWIIFSRQ